MEIEVGTTIFGSAIEITETEHVEVLNELSVEQINRLLGFLKEDSLDDHDAELILNILRFHSTDISDYLPTLLERFPSLSKNVFTLINGFSIVKKISNDTTAEILRDFLKKSEFLSEFQLFWLAVIAENCLEQTKPYGEILNLLYDHSANSIIARAKILEIPTQEFGMKELREEHLKNGSSDWLSWASAMGSRTLRKAERNYVLDYFRKDLR